MFWAGIIGDELIGLFRVPEGVKLTSKSYINFLDDHLSQWLDDLPPLRRSQMIFMHEMLHRIQQRLLQHTLHR